MSVAGNESVRLPLICLTAFLLAACGRTEVLRPVDTIVRNVEIVNVSDGSTAVDHAVVVVDGRVIDIVDEGRVDEYTAEVIIDGGGNFLIPALADAHVHIQSAAELPLYIRYGIGIVVNMSGGPNHLKMREAVASGKILGPTIVTAGPTLDGDPPTNPLFVSVGPESAAEVVDWIAANGYDVVKIYQQMDLETLYATMRAARMLNLLATGHVSRRVGVNKSIEAGQRYMAHGEEVAFEFFNETTRRYDMNAVPELANQLSAAGVTVTPMLAYLENIPAQTRNLAEYLDADEMRVVPAAMRMSFDQRQGWFANREDPNGFIGQIESLAEFVATLTLALSERDATLILGTDAGFGGAIPGYSVHEELESLVDAGLAELDALQMATLTFGEYLQQIDPSRTPWGQIAPGYSASMVLVGTNPIDDIAATRDIRGVMVRGKWIDRDELMALEDAGIRRQGIRLPTARAFEDAVVAGDLDAARSALRSISDDLIADPLMTADNCIFLGYRHYYGGRRALAGQIYELCATMHPDSAPLWIHIARASESDKKDAVALDAYRRAQKLNPWYGNPGGAIDKLATASPGGN